MLGSKRSKKMTKFLVSVYEANQAYGGPEEGGWWYDVGELVRTVRTFASRGEASTYCRRMNALLKRTLNKDRAPLSSVVCDGWYVARVDTDIAPQYYPTETPYYC